MPVAGLGLSFLGKATRLANAFLDSLNINECILFDMFGSPCRMVEIS